MRFNNIQEYINAIEKLKQKYSYNTGVFKNITVEPKFVFRGHGNHEKYKLEPKIFRIKERNPIPLRSFHN